MTTRYQHSAGFTLIEVMIALVVFAVVSVALVKNTSMSLKQSGQIQERTTAWWLAENEMTRLRVMVKSDENFPNSGVSRTTIEMPQADWDIETTVESTENDYVRRIVVSVYKNDRDVSSAELIGFLGRY